MKKLLILGSVVSPCPPKKQGGTERVAYYQAKHLAALGMKLIFVGAKGTKKNFEEELQQENLVAMGGEKERIPTARTGYAEGALAGGKTSQASIATDLLKNIAFVEIGGGTAYGNQEDSAKHDPAKIEASRNLRLEMVHLARVQQLMIDRKDDYDFILNNMRGEAVFLPLAKQLEKTFINVMHLNIFDKLAELFKEFNIQVITISNEQRKAFPDLDYLATIYNPVSTSQYTFNSNPKNYALMVGTIGYHKNQKDAILASKKAAIPLVITGKIRDQAYFDEEIKPYVDGKKVTYLGELTFEEKLKLYQEAKVFLFPIKWQEPFGLVCIEALACGTPVISYPHGGPAEIVKDGVNGFFVNNADEMATKIREIDKIDRATCRRDTETRFSDEVIGKQYFEVLSHIRPRRAQTS